MKIDLHVHHSEIHHVHHLSAGTRALVERFLMDQAQQTAFLQGIATGLATVATNLADTGVVLARGLGEVTDEIAGLKTQIANQGNSTPEMDAAFQSVGDKLGALTGVAGGLATAAKTLDDINQNTAADAAAAGAAGTPGG